MPTVWVYEETSSFHGPSSQHVLSPIFPSKNSMLLVHTVCTCFPFWVPGTDWEFPRLFSPSPSRSSLFFRYFFASSHCFCHKFEISTTISGNIQLSLFRAWIIFSRYACILILFDLLVSRSKASLETKSDFKHHLTCVNSPHSSIEILFAHCLQVIHLFRFIKTRALLLLLLYFAWFCYR